MSVMSSSSMKTTDETDSTITIHNNLQRLNLNTDKLFDGDHRSSSSNNCDVTVTNNQYPTLSDDTASDSLREFVESDLSNDTENYDAILQRGNSVDHLKERAVALLQEELQAARKALELKDEECKELSSVRSKVEEELEELTASLFQEAHKMVHEANMKQHIAEKKLKEASGEIEALKTEVSALKSLVLTSTPSNPNPECHPQLIKKKKDVLGSPLRKNRLLRKRNTEEKSSAKSAETEDVSERRGQEIDLVTMTHLMSWLNAIDGNDSSMTGKSEAAFLERINHEDVIPCLTFSDSVMSHKIFDNVQNNTLTIEPLPKPIIKSCALAGSVLLCKHQIKFGDSQEWLPISVGIRARIASVCDYMTYIRYIKKKIVKHSAEQMYSEIIRLRKEICLAKLGFFKME